MAADKPARLVTGVRRGLGRYLHGAGGGLGLSRDNAATALEDARRGGVDTIVHCAATFIPDLKSADLPAYVNDHLLLTDRLLSIPHRRFVYLSSIAVYPDGLAERREDLSIDPSRLSDPYGLCKLMGEAMVLKRGRGPLILRPASLIGRDMKKNTLIKIVEDPAPVVFPSADSEFNFVRHADVGAFIDRAVSTGVEGVFNAASAGTVLLSRIAELLGKRVAYGSFRYSAAGLSNRKIASVAPAFARSSLDTLKTFLKDDLRRDESSLPR